MQTNKLTEKQKALLSSILSKKYNKFGEIKELHSVAEAEVYAIGHPICSPPLPGYCPPGGPYTSGPIAACPMSTFTYIYCAS